MLNKIIFMINNQDTFCFKKKHALTQALYIKLRYMLI